MKTHKYLSGMVIFVLGYITAFLSLGIVVYAHGGDVTLVHACVNNGNGLVRIVDPNDSCRDSENAVDWSIQGPAGPPGPSGTAYHGLPFFCNGCGLTPHASTFAGKDFSKAQIIRSDFKEANLTGVIFKGGYFFSTNFTNANLTGADLSDIHDIVGFDTVRNMTFTGANFTNANLSNSIFHNSNFTNTDFLNANLSNATFDGVNFSGAQNMATANVTGTAWINVTCPDGTSSNVNGNTCIGHF